ncbi:MAG: hypothetical protein U5R48_11475 [Gammaproteobacteria bacterium]|nr:hypothetical protein [Gammaproteobacteria bacterium]
MALKVRRMPKVSTLQAASSMVTVVAARKPVDSHWARSWVMPRAPMMSGMATLTMVPVSRVANAPSMEVKVTSER